MIEVGTVLGGRFRVLGVLGRGGMATVHLAEDLGSGERVALKLLHPHLTADPAARRRLAREVAAGRRLTHEGLLVARELFEADGSVGLVLPFHPGRTLAERVAVEGPLPPDQVVRLGRRLADALGAAHRAGVLHRDVSARNVLVDDRGAPVLTDLGLARVGDGGTARSTALLGTAGFVAPEVLSGERADPRSDLYGLGAVLYLAATGREPFAADHPQAALRKQLAGELAPLPDLPPWLDALIRALLDPDPARRPPGAAAVIAALEERRAPEVASAPPAAAAGTAVAAALPRGGYTVVVREPEERRDGRKARRALRRGARKAAEAAARTDGLVRDVSRLVEQAATAIEGFAGDPGPAVERGLADAVGRAAGLPPGAVREAPALEEATYRLVAHVDRPTAERLAEAARGLGMRARVHAERTPDRLPDWLLARWWVAIPLVWMVLPGLADGPMRALYTLLAAALTVLLAAVVGPLARQRLLPDSARSLPVAYTGDLAGQLAEGFRPAVLAPSTAAIAPSTASPAGAAAFAARAREALAALDAALLADPALAAPMRVDLRASVAALGHEVGALEEDGIRLEAELVAARAAAGGADGWAAERLARLDTLARGGVAVDAAERERLVAAIEAQDAAAAAEAALDTRRTATLARLLEIDATARRLRRERALEAQAPRPPEQALADLEVRARAATAARRELG